MARFLRRRPGGPTDGAALVLSLILVLVCASLGAAFTQFASATARRQSHAVAQLQAFYVAEAGLAEAFYSVRMGRNGKIADESVPARYGGANVWVESYEADDSIVYLRSTARRHLSDVSLGLVVKPEPPALGFFADEDLVIENVVLVDGFDSTERPYHEEVASLIGATPEEESEFTPEEEARFANGREHGLWLADKIGRNKLERLLDRQVTRTETESGPVYGYEHSPIDVRKLLTDSEYALMAENGIDIYETYLAGQLFLDADDAAPVSTASALQSRLLDSVESSGGWSQFEATAPERQALHTNKGGLLGSNGHVVFDGDGTTSAVHGTLVHGADDQAFGIDEEQVSGGIEGRSEPVELESVTVPEIQSSGDRVVESGIPEVIAIPSVRYGALTVRTGEDLVLRGPLTLVVDTFVLEAGAALELDTTLGDVEIYVRGSMDLDPAATVTTSGTDSREVSILAETGTGASSLAMEAISAFSGTIYAPDSEVTIGTQFEVFGGIVARRLVLQAGARLHFDHESYDGELPVPLVETWRILDLPSQGGVGRPAPAGREATLAQAHDASDVYVKIVCKDLSGNTRKYEGLESNFDYSAVSQILSIKRYEDPYAAAPEEVPGWLRKWLRSTEEGTTDLEGGTPRSAEESEVAESDEDDEGDEDEDDD